MSSSPWCRPCCSPAGGVPQLSEASLQRLAAVDRPVTMHVFTTPTCPHCPRAVSLAHEMAFASPHITAYAVEATEFPDLARRYRVNGVPKTVVNEEIEILGALPEDAFVEQALAAIYNSRFTIDKGISVVDVPMAAWCFGRWRREWRRSRLPRLQERGPPQAVRHASQPRP